MMLVSVLITLVRALIMLVSVLITLVSVLIMLVSVPIMQVRALASMQNSPTHTKIEQMRVSA